MDYSPPGSGGSVAGAGAGRPSVGHAALSPSCKAQAGRSGGARGAGGAGGPRAGGGVGAGPPALSLRVPLIFIKALKASPLASQAFD